MNSLEKPFSVLINFALVGLLLAGWMAARYPSYAATITISAVALSVVVSASIPLIKLYHQRLPVAKSVANEGDSASNSASAEPLKIDDINTWNVLLDRWSSHTSDREEFDNLIKRAIKDKFHRDNEKNEINIGIVNLVISNEYASIKLASDVGKKDEKRVEEKSHMILRPDLMITDGEFLGKISSDSCA